MGMLKEIELKLDALPPVQRKIAEYVINNSNEVIRMSISNLAKHCGAKSEASIVKFYRTLGFSGFHDFKVSLATEIAGKQLHNIDTNTNISVDDDIHSVRRKIFYSLSQVLTINNNSIDDEILQNVVEALYNAKRVIILGYGTSAVAAYDLFVKLTRLGIECHFNLDSHLTALILSEPKEGDVLFAISYSGESKDIVFQSRAVKGLAKIIALTGELNSPLAQVADLCINIQSIEITFHTDAMISRMVQIAIIDIIFTSLAIRGGEKTLARLTRARQGLSFIKF